ncbi:helix-turn-helix domain-containing protein [Sphingobium sp. B11D3A]|uniref:helix-turn-helix domain-containing protein n=1 Tax=Sphingobium sp. B11D3A TaxID=2940574 RepID=UPI00222484F7|nr:helix-turn-helix domain-containing protein [Sphingobium sp. B11D3A]MCW2390311.1 AraC family transcriptional activator of pobA [Sphingobium sp. B11D3A]
MTALPHPQRHSREAIVPAYDLYGEDKAPRREDFFHAETIAVRSRRYDWEIAPHIHASLTQMLFVARGEVRLHLAGEDRREVGPLLVCAPSGIVHGFGFSPDVEGFVVTASQDFVDSLTRQDALGQHLRTPAILRPDAALTARLEALGTALVEAEQDRFAPNGQRLHHALAEAWLRTTLAAGAPLDAARSTLAERFRVMVEATYREHRPIEHYAQRLHCTVRTLSRQTQVSFGMTPLQIINRRLLFEARRLLRFTNAGCSEVAAELGFDDPSYFSRFYKRMTGRAPGLEKRRENV